MCRSLLSCRSSCCLLCWGGDACCNLSLRFLHVLRRQQCVSGLGWQQRLVIKPLMQHSFRHLMPSLPLELLLFNHTAPPTNGAPAIPVTATCTTAYSSPLRAQQLHLSHLVPSHSQSISLPVFAPPDYGVPCNDTPIHPKDTDAQLAPWNKTRASRARYLRSFSPVPRAGTLPCLTTACRATAPPSTPATLTRTSFPAWLRRLPSRYWSTSSSTCGSLPAPRGRGECWLRWRR